MKKKVVATLAVILFILPTFLFAAILDFENPDNLGVGLGGEMLWNGTGGGHLFMQGHYSDDFIYFGEPTFVNSFQMNPIPFEGGSAGLGGDSVKVAAFGSTNNLLWNTTVKLDTSVGLIPYWQFAWTDVSVNTGGILTLMFSVENRMWPSIDNMVITQSNAVPIPGGIWLFGSGLIGLFGYIKLRTNRL